MAVLIECSCVVLKIAAIHARYTGGWNAFVAALPNSVFYYDETLACVGFMDPADCGRFGNVLQQRGMRNPAQDTEADFVYVSQRDGCLQNVDWICFSKVEVDGMKLNVCWHADQTPTTIAMPPKWKFEGSMSQSPMFVHSSELGDRLKFLRRDGNVDVYLDLQTQKELYTARPKIQGDPASDFADEIKRIMAEAFAIEAQGPVKKPSFWTRGDGRYKRVEKELLPAITKITEGRGHELPGAHLARGKVLRLLGRLPEAELALRRVHELLPQDGRVLLDLVRCLAEKGKPQEALQFARRAAELEPMHPAVLGNLAAALSECKQFAEARRVIELALEYDPSDEINRRLRDQLANL